MLAKMDFFVTLFNGYDAIKGTVMYDNLKSPGITNPDEIDRHSLRQEVNNDILKIHFQRTKANSSPRA